MLRCSTDGTEKLFAILDFNNIVLDAWMASSQEEAQADNSDKIVVEVTVENSPFVRGEQWIKKRASNEEAGH